MKANVNYSSRFRILKGGKISLVVSALLGSVSLSFAAPSGGVVTSGNATIDQVGKTTNINQSTSKASINWQKFGIKADEVVNFIQPDKNSITLNRVIGNERSIIDGALNANGQVWILNSNGVLFGKNASINTSGLLATTKNLSDTDFQSGNYNFSGDSTESIINQGTIKIKDNGYVILASNEVRNSGEIEAVKGRVQLTGTDEYTINLNGNSLVDLVVDKGVLDALVENSGTILADGGEVYLTTHAVDELLRGVVNNTGIIEANSLDGISGHVELFAHGGKIEVGGEIRAKDGFVETSGKFFSFNDAKIEAGEWLIDPVDVTIDASLASAIQSQLASGDMTIETVGAGADDGDITVNSDITWSSTNRLTLNADDQVIMNAKIENTNNSDGEVYFITNNGVVFNAGGKVVINNIHQLQAVDTALNGTYELGSNIDASDTRNWGSGAGFNPLGDNTTQFTGNFDGKGYIIDGLYINRPSEYYVGLFGYAAGATISNLGLTNLYVKGDRHTGGFIGASNNNTSISNSYAIGEVIGSTNVGGLIGNAYINTTINNSYTNTTINSNSQGGGLVGTAQQDLKIFNSYAIGKINSGGYKGGLIGYSINGSNVITNSYWDIDTTGMTSGVGFLGSLSPGTFVGIYSSTNTVNAFNQATYAGFDFANDWFMIEGETRPFLRSEYSTTITNDHQLQLMAMDLTANYTLANDIKYTGDMWSSKGFDPIGDDSTYFTGNFDGKSHVIDGLYINRGSENNIGLFGQNWSSKSISNLGLTNVDITGRYDVGGLVGDALALTINNSYVTGTINGNNSVGGLMGYANDNTSITNSYTSVNLTGNNNLGGLLGYKDSSSNLSISDSYTTGSINGNSNLGGLVGNVAANASTISNSYSTATVSGSGQLIGGLVGRLYPSTSQNNISNSYASGDVSGDDNVGGLVGYSYRGQINNSYSSGNVSGDDNIGGLVGHVYGTTINNSYSSGDVTGNHKVGGLVGFYDGYETISNSYASGAITGVSRVGGVVGALSSTASILNPILNSYWDIDTTGQALGVGDGDTAGTTGIYSSTNTINAFDKATYAGFDFTNDWIIYEGHTRPLLRAFMTDLTVSANDHTRTYDGTTYSVGSAGVTYSNPSYDSSLVHGSLNYTSSDDLKNAGTATIGVDGLYSSQHGYIISYDTGTLTTNKKDITVTANSKTTTYDGTIQTSNGFTANGLVSGETIAVLDGVTGDNVIGTNAGTYNTNLSGTDENYNITFVDGSLVINKKDITVTGNSKTTTYDGTTQTSSGFTANGLVSGETIAVLDGVTGDNVIGTNAGTYNTNLSGTDENYNITFVDGSLVISKKELTANYTADNKVYDGNTDAVVNGTLIGVISGEAVSISNTSANFTDKNAGTGKTVNIAGITLGGVDSGNYSISTTNSATANILKKDITVTANSKTTTYDGTTQTSSGFTANGLVSGETIAVLDGVTGDNVIGTNAGTYNTNLSGTDENYNITFVDGSLVISKKELTANYTADNKVYDGNTDAVVNGTLIGVISGEAVSISNTSANFTDKNAGTGKTVNIAGISLGGVDSGNYSISTTNSATADITKRALSLEASKDYDGTDDLTGFVTFGNLVGAETLEYTGAKANSKDSRSNNFISSITLADGKNVGLVSNYELPSLLAHSSNNRVSIGAKPNLSDIITPIANKTVFTNKDIETLLKSGVDIQTIFQQLNTNELALIPGVVLQMLNGGINLPFGSKQQFSFNDENEI